MVSDVLKMRCDLNEGLEIDAYDIKQSEGRFTFAKKNSTDKYYTTKLPSGKWKCTCTGYKYRGTCKHCEYASAHSGPGPKRHPRSVITDATKDIMPKLQALDKNARIVGSYRREKADSKDIDILMDCSAEEFAKVNGILKSYPNFRPVVSGPSIIRGFVNINGEDIEMDVNRLGEKANPPLALLYRTGPGDFNMALRSMAKDMGGCLNENEFILNGHIIEVAEEKDVFDALGIEYLEPKDRSVENIRKTKAKQTKYFKVYRDGEEVGPAPSLAYAKQQNTQLREIGKTMSKAPLTYKGKVLDVRYTFHEDEEECSDTDIRTSTGKSVPAKRMKLTITPVIKSGGKRLSLDDEGEYMGKKGKLGDLVEKLWSSVVKAEMKMPRNKVSELYKPTITLEGGKLVFGTVPYGTNTRV